jgi:serine/threonine-protein kinase RsbW
VDTITVRIPAAPQYVQVVRLIAAGLASRLGFTIDEIEDLKIGVDELAAYVTGPQGRDGTLDIVFEVEGHEIAITGTGRLGSGQSVRTELSDFSRQILQTVVDEATLRQFDGFPSFRIVKTGGS